MEHYKPGKAASFRMVISGLMKAAPPRELVRRLWQALSPAQLDEADSQREGAWLVLSLEGAKFRSFCGP
jgi:hypothetical protein